MVGGSAALAALAGAVKGLVIVLGTILLEASEGPEGRPRASSFLLLWGATAGAAAVLRLFGIAGTGYTIANRARTGTWMMLAGAVGVLASAYSYSAPAGCDGPCVRALSLS